MADHDDVGLPVPVIEVAQPQFGDRRQVAVQYVVATLPAGHRGRQVPLVPALVDRVELGDRIVVVAVLQVPGLHLVNAFDFPQRQSIRGAGHFAHGTPRAQL